METISILLPFKNEEAYIQECIASIKAQTHNEWQLIAVDDHSEDQGRNLIEKEKDPRIEVYTNIGRGVLPALQTAQKHIKGFYVTRMDADDVMPIHKLETLLKQIKSYDQKVVATGCVEYFSSRPISEGYLRFDQWLNETADTNQYYKRI